jgi:hypothetical protein
MKKWIFCLLLSIFALQFSFAQQIYIVGRDDINAVYWLNGNRNVLPGDGIVANSIAVSESDICIAGYDGYDGVCWYNNKPIRLPTRGESSEGTSIAILESNIYISGYDGGNHGPYRPVYWLAYDREVITRRSIRQIFLPNPIYTEKATSIAISGSDIYITGIAGGDVTNAVYWHNGERKVLPKSTTSSAAGTNSIAVHNSNVYIVGYDYSNNSGRNAVYWLNDKQIILSKSGKHASTKAIAISGSNIYIVGLDGDDAVYWLNGNRVVLPKLGSSARANAIAISGSNIYIVGEDGDDAVYWLNGNRAVLPKLGNSAKANDIAIIQ